jgi:hypothetical protein
MSVPFHALFHFLLYTPVFAKEPEGNEARLTQRLVDSLSQLDYRTEIAPTLIGAKVAAGSDMGIGCFLLAIDGPNEAEVQELVHAIRHERGLDTPIYLISELAGVDSLSLAPLGDVTGYIYLDQETPAFSAKEAIFALERYAQSLKPPFFGALMDYEYEGNQMWTCPGHQGGSFYRRSPVGKTLRGAPGRSRLPQRHRQLGARTRRPADPRRPRAGRADGSRQGVRCGPHVLHPQRHVDLEQGSHLRDAQARRPGALRSQQPQVQPSGRVAAGGGDPRSTSRPTATPRA